MTKISIVVPVYNEEKAILNTLDQLERVTKGLSGFQFEFVVVNDASTDATAELLSKQKGIILITNPYNLGYGASLKRGIRRSGGEWILITDADGTYPLEAIPLLLSKIGDYDMVIGKRVAADDGTSWLRRRAKKFLNSLTGWLTHFPVEDINSGMRVFRRDLCLEFFNLYPRGFSFTTTITIAFIRSQYPIGYVPIDYGKRIGHSSIVPTDFLRFLGVIFKTVFYFHPWRFLAPLAVVLALVAVAKGGFDLIYHNAVGNFSILLITLAGLIILFALLADLLFKQRRL